MHCVQTSKEDHLEDLLSCVVNSKIRLNGLNNRTDVKKNGIVTDEVFVCVCVCLCVCVIRMISDQIYTSEK